MVSKTTMDSFDQLIKLAHESNESHKKFLEENLDVSVEQAFFNYYNANQICTNIQDKLDKVEKTKERSSYANDFCAYFMAKDTLTNYKHDALLVFASKLSEEFKRLAERKTEEKQKESLKQLLKEVIKEAKEEEQIAKPSTRKQRTRLNEIRKRH